MHAERAMSPLLCSASSSLSIRGFIEPFQVEVVADEVLVTLIVLREKDQMEVCLLTRRAAAFYAAPARNAVSQPMIGFTPRSSSRCKRDRAVHIAVVRHRTRRHG